MKKIVIGIFFLFSGFAFAQDIEIGQQVYKTVVINGEEVKKWVVLNKFTRFNNEQRPVYEKGLNDMEVWWKYDDKGHIKSEEHKNSGITNFECDDEGRIIHSRWDAPSGMKGLIREESWNEYNLKENVLYVHSFTRHTNDNGTISEFNVYDEGSADGKLIHRKTDNGEDWYKYDENGNIYQQISSSYGSTSVTSYKTDMKGNITYFKSPRMERWNEYNSNGLCVYSKEIFNGSWISEYIYEYTYWNNGKIKTCSMYKL